MRDLEKDTKLFIDKIKQSSEYSNYVKAKEDLEAMPKLKQELDEFRRNYFEIQLGHDYGYFNSYEQLVSLKNLNDELLSNPYIKIFMDAELKLTETISRIFYSISDALDFDIEFLE